MRGRVTYNACSVEREERGCDPLSNKCYWEKRRRKGRSKEVIGIGLNALLVERDDETSVMLLACHHSLCESWWRAAVLSPSSPLSMTPPPSHSSSFSLLLAVTLLLSTTINTQADEMRGRMKGKRRDRESDRSGGDDRPGMTKNDYNEAGCVVTPDCETKPEAEYTKRLSLSSSSLRLRALRRLLHS